MLLNGKSTDTLDLATVRGNIEQPAEGPHRRFTAEPNLTNYSNHRQNQSETKGISILLPRFHADSDFHLSVIP